MPDVPVSPEEHRLLEIRHRDFMAGRPVAHDGVRDFILDSWLRCRKTFADGRGPKFCMAPEMELEARRARNSMMLTHAASVMHSIFELLDGPEEGIKGVACCVFVTDREGVLLAKVDNRETPLQPGVRLEESLIGTNSVHSCMENRYISTVYGYEHYFAQFAGHVCSASPVITEDGVIHGAFGVLLRCGDYNLSVKGMSDVAVRAISSLMNASVHRAHRELLLDFVDDVVIYADRQGRVIAFNREAAEAFSDLGNGRPLAQTVPFARDFQQRLTEGTDCTDFFITLRGSARKGLSYYATLRHDDLGGLALLLRRARKVRELAARVATTGAVYHFDDIRGESPALRRTIALARKAAVGDMTILITGESGTGKELFAHAIHNAGPRASRPFLIVNCGALPHGLIQSELFGYEEGAFTGASVRGKAGKFALADGGTLFLDEVGELPLDVQANLLRFLQSGEISKIGAARPYLVDVRVIAATNRDLSAMVRQGLFREDLFYRLSAFPLRIPALRERDGDVLVLARQFTRAFSLAARGRELSLSEESCANLVAHTWPGNVRELENCIRLHVNLAEGDSVEIPALDPVSDKEERVEGFAARRSGFERKLLAEALDRHGGNIRNAASFLGMPLSTMYSKIARYRLMPERRRTTAAADLPERDADIARLVAALAPESKESLYQFLKSLS